MKIAVFGTSGFAREVADVCAHFGSQTVLVGHEEEEEKQIFGYSVVPESEVQRLEEAGYEFALGMGSGDVRRKVYRKFPRLSYPSLVHPEATLGVNQKEALLGKKGNVLTAGTRLTNNIRVGHFGVYNLNCTVGHDCVIEDFVTLSPGANISGNVHLRERAYIGTGAVVLQGRSIEEKLEIGEGATVGAGAVVTKSVAQRETVVGMPAKPIGK